MKHLTVTSFSKYDMWTRSVNSNKQFTDTSNTLSRQNSRKPKKTKQKTIKKYFIEDTFRISFVKETNESLTINKA